MTEDEYESFAHILRDGGTLIGQADVEAFVSTQKPDVDVCRYRPELQIVPSERASRIFIHSMDTGWPDSASVRHPLVEVWIG